MSYTLYFRPSKTRACFVTFVYIVAANIPLWIASRSMGLLLTGIFNAEFLVIGILSFFVRRTVTVGLLLAAITLDIVRGIGSTYRFSPSEMLHSVRYLFGSSPSHLRQVTVVAICIAVVCVLAVFASSKGTHGWEREFVVRTLLGFFLFCVAVDVSTGHFGLYRRDVDLGVPRLTRFPSHFLVMSELEQVRFRDSGVAGIDASAKSASMRLVALDAMSASKRTSATEPNNVHRSVAELAMRETARPTVFLVVGDHAPPFSSAKLRSQFSDDDVPYVLLVPKTFGVRPSVQGSSLLEAVGRSSVWPQNLPVEKGRSSAIATAASAGQ